MAKSPSVARSRACGTSTRNSCASIPSTILDRLAAMGISREVAEKVLAAIRADAAARPSGKVRTAQVLAALQAQGIAATAPAIKILAGSIGIEPERGAEPGKGTGGRPFGSADRRPRDPKAHAKRETIARLRDEHPEWSEDKIGEATAAELGLDSPLDRQLVNYHIAKLRRDKD